MCAEVVGFETRSFVTLYQPSLKTWFSLFESGRWEVAVRTLRIALTVTLIELVVGFPFALWLAKGCRSKTTQAAVLTLLTIPFFLDMSSRPAGDLTHPVPLRAPDRDLLPLRKRQITP